MRKRLQFKEKKNNKGFVMAITVAYMALVVSLSVAILSIANIETEYSTRRRNSVSNTMIIDSIGFDFVHDGDINGTYEGFTPHVLAVNADIMYVLDSDNGVRLTVKRDGSGHVLYWYYGYTKSENIG